MRLRPSTIAWLSIPVDVIVADLVLMAMEFRRRRDAPEAAEILTLSGGFREAAHHPVRRWPVTLAWAYITAHLFLDLRWDPLHILGRWLRLDERVRR